MAGVGPSQGNPHVGLDVGSWESAIARMEPDGTVRLFVGTSPQGQGHATTFVQLAADRLGVPPDDIELVHSDTDRSPYSAYGTAASRAIAVGGGGGGRGHLGAGRADPQDRGRDARGRARRHRPRRAPGHRRRHRRLGVHRRRRPAGVAGRGPSRRARRCPDSKPRFAYDPEQYTYSLRHPRVPGRGRPRHGDRRDRALRRGARLRHGGQPDHRRGPGPRWGRPGPRRRTPRGHRGRRRRPTRTTTLLDYLLPVSASVPDIDVVLTETPSPFTPGG